MTLNNNPRSELPARVDEGVAWFEGFERNRLPRVKVALVAAFGAETGSEAGADAAAYAWEHRDRLAAMTNPAGYLFRVGQSSARRHRRWQRPPPPPSVTASYEVDVDPDLPRALARLTLRRRTAVVLVHVNGWTLDETAQSMGVAVPTVRTHLARGMERLARLLQEGGLE
jgi:RNA polymerase sigma-70 factor (ECF subfamily)